MRQLMAYEKRELRAASNVSAFLPKRPNKTLTNLFLPTAADLKAADDAEKLAAAEEQKAVSPKEEELKV